jgi:hypothetical protein
MDALTSTIYQIDKRSPLQCVTCFFSNQKVNTLEDLTYHRELQRIANKAPALIIVLLRILLVTFSL